MVGCESGNLGAMSRVQLLLLDRPDPETLPGHLDEEDLMCPLEDWMQDVPGSTSAGASRPPSASSVSERCDSMRKVDESKSEHSGGSCGSPASWTSDGRPSLFRKGVGGPAESNCPARTEEDVESSDGGRSLEHMIEAKERMMAERKRKALNILSKLQNLTACQPGTDQDCSNFEDFDVLAKYCIFSQEKLEEYKQAFVKEDSDGDGYISCLQVLLALKSIIPSGLLSEEQEIYVYRILEMVDFRVTDGLVDLRLFAVIASLAQKIAAIDEFMQSLISSMDFRSLEVMALQSQALPVPPGGALGTGELSGALSVQSSCCWR
ncbi:uncharacterized protein LOC117504382 isoform X2 [Thalassophryne amazonica]|uniref:uncharacterized protein LOC117504382 isoform X2 n=1 Tax=Thalassophryne amazonica TaxID=390379 RepID=UPI0014714F4C|nr:uncharacterized protein LOC117504382 isoform X2 [Thalassophryne amazonica]